MTSGYPPDALKMLVVDERMPKTLREGLLNVLRNNMRDEVRRRAFTERSTLADVVVMSVDKLVASRHFGSVLTRPKKVERLQRWLAEHGLRLGMDLDTKPAGAP